MLTMVESYSIEDTSPTETSSCAGDLPAISMEKERRLPQRTASMPKRTIWKDKGGSARYVLGEEPKPEEVKPPSWDEVAKEALADAVISSGAAGLAVFDAVTNTKQRLQRSISSTRIARTLSHSGEQHETTSANATWGKAVANTKQRLQRSMSSTRMVRTLSRDQPQEKASANATWSAKPDPGPLGRGRGLLLRAKSIGAVRGVGVRAMPQRPQDPERIGVVTNAA
jgi:hypothetical protein